MSKRISEDASCVLDSLKKLKSSEISEEIGSESTRDDTVKSTIDNTVESTKEIQVVQEHTGVKYVKDGPFLRVEPYWFDYCTWAKGRWFNTPLIAVFRKEFRDRPAAYYSHACQAGLIRINDTRISEDYKIKQGDRVQHKIHRHEPPVLVEPEPEILHVAEGLLVVSKPPSIPMHPSGRYRHNTLTSLLLHRHPELFPTGHISCVNRLDRLVSGIVILSRSAEKADELRRAMQDMKFRKFYLARVKGDFDALKTFDYSYARKNENDTVECLAPLHLVEHKLGLSCVADSVTHPAAKASHTRFKKLTYDPNSDFSLILCEPVTGRTHQIRLHLQYLGYPIHNDPLYNNPFWHDLITHSSNDEIYKNENWIQRVKEMAQSLAKSPLFHQEDEEFQSSSSSSSALCPDCENPLPDPDPAAMRIDLHAYKYEGPMGTFSTSLPEWASLCREEQLKAAEEAFNSLASGLSR